MFLASACVYIDTQALKPILYIYLPLVNSIADVTDMHACSRSVSGADPWVPPNTTPITEVSTFYISSCASFSYISFVL